MTTTLFNPTGLETRSIREAVQSSLPYFKGRVLDIGCGQKPYLFMLHDRVDCYVGMDLETVGASAADVYADSLCLPFRPASFDTVFSTQVIEHVTNPFRMMREISAVLKPGGALVLTAPQAWPLHEVPHDYFRYTRYGLAELARQSGLEVVHMKERRGGFYALGAILCILLYTRHQAHTFRRRMLKPMFWIVQGLAAVLDRIFFLPDFTLGYILVAKKRP